MQLKQAHWISNAGKVGICNQYQGYPPHNVAACTAGGNHKGYIQNDFHYFVKGCELEYRVVKFHAPLRTLYTGPKMHHDKQGRVLYIDIQGVGTHEALVKR